MKVKAIIEQYDNGISLKYQGQSADDDIEPVAIVALERDIEYTVGKTIWDDVRRIMNLHLTNSVEITIEYKPVE